MKLGTIVFEDKIYNLDHMNIDELKDLLEKVEKQKRNDSEKLKDIVNE